MTEHVPPHNLEAELSVLGAVLFDNAALAKTDLLPEDFYLPKHADLFRAMLALQKDNDAIDLITLDEHLKRERLVEKVGGIQYLSRIANSVPTAANIKYHARIVREKAQLRRLRRSAMALLGEIDKGEATIEELYERHKRLLGDMAGANAGEILSMEDVAKKVSRFVDQRYYKRHELSGVPTGFKELDFYTDGWQAGDSIVIGARPGHGKTAFVLDSAEKSGERCGIISIEMSEQQLGIRSLAKQSRVGLTQLRRGFFDKEEWPNITQALGRMAELPIWMAFSSSSGLEIERATAKMVEECRIKLLIVDYIQLAKGSDGKRERKREEEVGEISRLLKRLAKLHGIPVIGISQLNRAVEQRSNKHPTLADLRDSGQIEQDADIVIFLHRENPRASKAPVPVKLIIAKGRNIETGEIKLMFDGQHMTFYDELEGGEGEEEQRG